MIYNVYRINPEDNRHQIFEKVDAPYVAVELGAYIFYDGSNIQRPIAIYPANSYVVKVV